MHTPKRGSFTGCWPSTRPYNAKWRRATESNRHPYRCHRFQNGSPQRRRCSPIWRKRRESNSQRLAPCPASNGVGLANAQLFLGGKHWSLTRYPAVRIRFQRSLGTSEITFLKLAESREHDSQTRRFHLFSKQRRHPKRLTLHKIGADGRTRTANRIILSDPALPLAHSRAKQNPPVLAGAIERIRFRSGAPHPIG